MPQELMISEVCKQEMKKLIIVYTVMYSIHVLAYCNEGTEGILYSARGTAMYVPLELSYFFIICCSGYIVRGEDEEGGGRSGGGGGGEKME